MLFICSQGHAQLAWQNQINELVSQSLPTAEIGIMVMDADSGKTLYEYNAYKAFMPASTMKLFSAAAALDYLTGDYQFDTSASINSSQLQSGILYGSLYFKFTGDPSLTNSDLATLVRQVKSYGIRQINGNVVLDDSRYQQPYFAPGWTADSLYWAFSAPISAIILNQNQVTLEFLPSRTLGRPVTIMPGPNMRYMGLQYNINTVTYDQAMHACSLVIRVNENNVVQLGGCWPAGDKGWQSISIQNPSLYASKVLQNYFAEAGIKVNGQFTIGVQPANLKIIADHRSQKLSRLLVKMLKDSDNIYAESLLKTLGYYHNGVGSFQAGVNAMKAIDGNLADINFQQTVIFDGSGQSRYDLVMPKQIAQLLYAIYHNDQLRQTIINALPISGIDGTLSYRMTSAEMRGKVRAKTGSVSGGSALSGYLITQSGHKLIFSIIMNNFVGKIRQARTLQDEICEALYQA